MPQPSVAPTTQASFASNLAGLILRHMLVFDFLNCQKVIHFSQNHRNIPINL